MDGKSLELLLSWLEFHGLGGERLLQTCGRGACLAEPRVCPDLLRACASSMVASAGETDRELAAYNIIEF